MTRAYDEKYNVCRILLESSVPCPQNQMMKTKIGLEGFFQKILAHTHTPNDVYFVSIKILFLFSFFSSSGHVVLGFLKSELKKNFSHMPRSYIIIE